MYLLILSEEIDKSSDFVCAWLHYFHFDFVRINQENFFNPILDVRISIDESSIQIMVDDRYLNFSEISTIWARRGYARIYPIIHQKEYSPEIVDNLKRHMNNESETLRSYIWELFSTKKMINHPEKYNFNKLIALHYAASIGLEIPDTIVTRNGNNIENFLKQKGNCITKSIQDITNFSGSNTSLSIGKIRQITISDVTEPYYWYSLIQKEIPKRYELRIFYWLGKCYSMAIFSQLDPDSSLDFRDVDVNGIHPNRMVPYKLPKDIQTKINKLMKTLKLESGSIDMIVTPENEYVFLEVNPVGQFNFVSELCNYYIEKDIAKSLMS